MKGFLLAILIIAAPVILPAQGERGGSLICEQLRLLDFNDREELISNEIISGNYPHFLKNWEKISFSDRDANGKKHRVILFVKPDYLSAGNDSDFFIIPMGPITAQKIADAFDASLPTPKIVDLVYRKSKLKLEPFNYIPRGNRNETPDILYDHSKVIQAQIKASGNRPGIFVAGTKKDIVISSKLHDSLKTHHVTIYGWHRLNGKPIQPVTNIHINIYVDYSHGVRLISNRVVVDGKEYNYRDILKDAVLHTLLSNEKQPLVKTSYLPE